MNIISGDNIRGGGKASENVVYDDLSRADNFVFLLHALAYSYAPGELTVGSSPSLWRPRFCDNPQEGTGEGSKKNPHDKNCGSHPERRGGQGIDRHCPLLDRCTVFQLLPELAFFLIGFGIINPRNHQCYYRSILVVNVVRYFGKNTVRLC